MTLNDVEELAREVADMQTSDDSQVQLPCATVLALLALARRALTLLPAEGADDS